MNKGLLNLFRWVDTLVKKLAVNFLANAYIDRDNSNFQEELETSENSMNYI